MHSTASFSLNSLLSIPRVSDDNDRTMSPTHLAVVVAHAQEGHGAVGVAAVADRRHVSVPHDGQAGQRLSRGVGVRDGVALAGRGS